MKINWGTGIVIGMTLFISFILYLVFNMLTNEKFDHDLVTEDYYKKELLFQQEIDAETRGNALTENISDRRIENGWLIEFPEDLKLAEISGNLNFYRPSNAELDFDIPLNLKSNRIEIDDAKLIPGRWNINIHWEYQGENYLYKKEIVY
ncbi:MAG: FixH family protein [Salegentibacter sp.]|uniref:FixH protein n=1 Tax=Salegentibacter flavus TaxID=287099 RepID=A0A1I5CG32_9FLAO|nr:MULTISPECIES: FixH family protein [Salegentibacter]MDR9457164.1 FixH family protein [Salegentibacter sp.]SFN85960.1 FixH protein [Salegentibacter flavus]